MSIRSDLEAALIAAYTAFDLSGTPANRATLKAAGDALKAPKFVVRDAVLVLYTGTTEFGAVQVNGLTVQAVSDIATALNAKLAQGWVPWPV